jgi:hypothetical protein
MTHCPQCHSEAMHRARTRTLFERLRRTVTAERLHKCSECGWRGWGPDHVRHKKVSAIVAAQAPDLLAIDAELQRAGERAANSAAVAAIGGREPVR